MARCELHGRKAEAAARELLPLLLVKREDALILIDLCRLKRKPKEGVRPYTFQSASGRIVSREYPVFSSDQRGEMNRLREILVGLHEGRRRDSCPASEPVNVDSTKGMTAEESLACMAGVMDSDGNFRVERKRARGMLGPHYRINMRASQVAPSPAIHLLARRFGGRVRVVKSRRANHRDLLSWSLHDRRAEIAIRALIPYLTVKRREAGLLLELRRLKAMGKKGRTVWIHKARGPRHVPMPKQCYTLEQIAEFERIRLEVHGLHRGSSFPIAPPS